MFIRKLNQKSVKREDSELIQLYKESGDSFYLGELYQRYMHLVLGTCLKYLGNQEEARDMVMQIYEKLVNEILNHEIRNFSGWLHVLTRNHCLMQLRKVRSYDAQIVSIAETTELPVEELQEEKDQEKMIEELTAGLEQLAPEQKQCVELFYLQKMSYAEITGITGYDQKKVKSYIQNGKRNLKILLTRKNGKS